MTTISYRDGILAADSATTMGDVVIVSKVPKIASNKSGDLAGACGPAGFCDAFLEWFDNGEHGTPPKFEEAGRGMVIRQENGQIELYDASGVSYMHAEYLSLGSGATLAMGAMWAGKDAKASVNCAIQHDPYTRGPVVCLKLGKKNGNKR